MKSKRLTGCGLCVVALAGLLVVGCNGAPEPSGGGGGESGVVKADNLVCPIMGNTLPAAGVPADQTRKYKGKTIGFCCAPCGPKWDELSDAAKDAHLAKMFAAPAPAGAARVINTKCPIMGGKVDPATVPPNLVREFGGKKIGFCCAGCPPKWDALADEKKAKIVALFTGSE